MDRVLDRRRQEMTNDPAELRRMTDDELTEAYRRLKTETTGRDPALTPPDEDSGTAIREEMERRGLAPDREDVVPDAESPEEDPIVDDRA
jgi:hypothetical protein